MRKHISGAPSRCNIFKLPPLVGEVFETEAEYLDLKEGVIQEVMVTFNLEKWFNTLTENQIENAITDANGKIIISDSKNEVLHDKISDRLDNCTEATFPGI